MIKKYDDFIDNRIDESIDMFSLLESNVSFSNLFRRVLNTIDNPVSSTLLSIENVDLPVAANYFDIDKKRNDYLFFTPDKKAVEIIKESKEVVKFIGDNGGWLKHSEANASIFEKLGYKPAQEVYIPSSNEIGVIESEMISSKSGKVFCKVVFDGGEGVFNKTKLLIFNDSDVKVWNSNRQAVKIGRSMNALLKIANKNGIKNNFSSSDIENFVNVFKTKVDILNDVYTHFDIIKGKEIAFWYNDNNYYEKTGTLGSSCMSSVPSSYFNLYTTSKNVSLVILRSKENYDKIIGRSLLWTLNDGVKFMDRIYSISDSDITLFKQYAKDNGWCSKNINNSSDSGNVILPDGKVILRDLTCELDDEEIEYFPYLDTLKYYYYYDNIISNSHNLGGNYHTLESTGGAHNDSECDFCNGASTYECGDCEGSGKADCDDCDSGKVDCDECVGIGTVDENDMEIQCSSCEGSGKEYCGTCEGSAQVECSRCSGDGEIDCPECN